MYILTALLPTMLRNSEAFTEEERNSLTPEKTLICRYGKQGVQESKGFSPTGLSWGPRTEDLTTAAFQEQVSCAKRGKPETSPES